jgi:uncharacterized tellurite resistance protein B-like protein
MSSTGSFSAVERVVADPIRFKLRLGIGDDAYASLRLKKSLSKLWDVAGAGGTGAGVAASPIVAGTLFPAKGILAMLGFGMASTPMGWIVAAALVSAGGYYGVLRMFDGFSGSRVEVLPKFINTPIDLLGAALLDLMGALAVRVAAIDGYIDDAERNAMTDHFVETWGFDRDYVGQAINVLERNIEQATIKDLALQLAIFLRENPDCNPTMMRVELVDFLKEIALADGRLDEREDLAIDAVAAAMTADHTVGAQATRAVSRARAMVVGGVAIPAAAFRTVTAAARGIWRGRPA